MEDGLRRADVNLTTKCLSPKSSENGEFLSHNSEKLTLSHPPEKIRGSSEKQKSQRVQSSLPCSKQLSGSAENTVANMVLSQGPFQMRSSYYGDCQRNAFVEICPNYQQFVAQQRLPQFQNVPQFNSFSGNGKACYNNSFSKFTRSCYQVEPKNGMKDVPLWLKSLRLHKYTPLLASMSYDEMMRLDETRLEYLGVTKGARRKIMQSIEKLRERVALLRNMEKAIDEGYDYGHLTCLITELRGTMNTPIRGYPPPGYTAKKNITRAQIEGFDIPAEKLDEENLPGHLIRIIGKVQAILTGLNAPCLSEDCFAWLMQTLDRISLHDAFTPAQKTRAAAWKRSFKKICSPSVTRRNMRKPNASVLLASGGGNNPQANCSGSQGTQAAAEVQRKRSEQNQNRKMQNGAHGPNLQLVHQQRQLQQAMPMVSQTCFQNALNSLFQALSSNNSMSQQTAAYYLGIASVTAALSSSEIADKVTEMIKNGNLSQNALNHLQRDTITRLLKQPGFNANNGVPYAPMNYYAPQDYSRNGSNMDANFNGHSTANGPPHRRPVWSSYLGAEEQHTNVVPTGISHFPESLHSDYQSNNAFPTPKSSSVSNASTSAFSSQHTSNVQNVGVNYSVGNHNYNQNVNFISPSTISHSTGNNGQYKQPSRSLFSDFASVRPDVLHIRPQEMVSSNWYDVPATSSLKITPTESLFESITSLSAEHSNLRVAEPRKQTRKLCNDESSLFGAALPTRPAAGSPSEQLNSLSPSPGCSSNASERGSGAGSPPGLLVYNFVNEGSSGELDSACRSAALEENHSLSTAY